MVQELVPEGALEGPSGVLTGVIVTLPGTGLSALAVAAVAKGTAASTKRAYDKDWRQFKVWCGQNGRESLPATAETLTEYTAYLCYQVVPGGVYNEHLAASGRRGLALSSVNRALSAITVKHREENLDPPKRDGDTGAYAILRGYKAHLALAKDSRATPRQAPAMTSETLQRVRDTTVTRLKELRDRALVLLGFGLGARISELVLLDVEDIEQLSQGLLVSVYRQKTRKHHKVKIPRAYVPGIVEGVQAWIGALAEAGYTAGPMFPRIDRYGHLGPGGAGRKDGNPDGRMTANAAGRAFSAAMRQAGPGERWTTHSLRRGMATEARYHGHDQITIAKQGGWAPNSASMLGYMEDGDGWVNNALKGMDL